MGPKGSAKFRKSLELATETRQGMQYPEDAAFDVNKTDCS